MLAYYQHDILNEAALAPIAYQLAKQLEPGDTVFLQGPLGAGKTSFVRALLRALGYAGHVKSPTYTLIEPYEVDGKTNKQIVHHFDLYRLQSPVGILELGLEDYLTADAICLIEWPEKAAAYLPDPTLYCTIEVVDATKRRLWWRSENEQGQRILTALDHADGP